MNEKIIKFLLPLLKSHQWNESQRLNGFVTDVALVDGDSPEQGPIIAYGFDQGESINYLHKGSFPEIRAIDIKQRALTNLRRKLAGLDWQVLDFPGQSPSLKVLAFSGHFHAAECLLLKERMQETHGMLKAKRLLACTPCRGLLLILPFDGENQDALEIFLSVCLENYYASGKEPISDVIWILVEGNIKGHLAINREYKDYLSEQNRKQIKQSTVDRRKKTGNIDLTSSMHQLHRFDAVKLYTPMQISVAAFLGTALAGLVAMGINYKTLGYREQTKNTVIAAVLAVPAMITAFAYIPDTRFDQLFPATTALVMFCIARILQGQKIENYFLKGGKRKSFWKVTGVVLFSLMVVLFMLVLGMWLFDFGFN